jgi:hypothetical protein
MDKPTPAVLPIDAATTATAGAMTPEAKPDPLSMMAIDANALAEAIASGQGHDLSRLINDLLKSRAAA